jgi:hypothetical protein
MPGGVISKRFALDSNLLLDLAGERAHISVLVTSDHHLLDIPEDRLLVCFNDADLAPVRPAHPKGLLKAMR